MKKYSTPGNATPMAKMAHAYIKIYAGSFCGAARSKQNTTSLLLYPLNFFLLRQKEKHYGR